MTNPAYQHLLDFINDKRQMRMSHIYQPVMLTNCLRRNRFSAASAPCGRKTSQMNVARSPRGWVIALAPYIGEDGLRAAGSHELDNRDQQIDEE
jgi:hypothetical protein